MNAHTDLAIRYNDVAVLENHHAAVCFQLLQSTDLLSSFSREQFKEVHVCVCVCLSSASLSAMAAPRTVAPNLTSGIR